MWVVGLFMALTGLTEAAASHVFNFPFIQPYWYSLESLTHTVPSKVFIHLDLFHISLCYSLNSKLIKYVFLSPSYTQYTIMKK